MKRKQQKQMLGDILHRLYAHNEENEKLKKNCGLTSLFNISGYVNGAISTFGTATQKS